MAEPDRTAGGHTLRISLLLWPLALLLAGLNGWLSLAWPRLNGEAEPLAMVAAARCAPMVGLGPLLDCVGRESFNYAYPYVLLSSLAARLLGEGYRAALVLAGLCFASALVGVWRLGEALALRRDRGDATGARWVGSWALLLWLGAPLTSYLGGRAQLDIFQIALLTWTLVWWLRSDGLRRSGPAGAVAGLLFVGLLTKPSQAFFTAGPLALSLWGTRRRRGWRRSPRAWMGPALVALGVVLAVAFYLRNPHARTRGLAVGSSLRSDDLAFPDWPVTAPGPGGWGARWSFFAMALVGHQAGWLVAGLCLLGAWRARREAGARGLLASYGVAWFVHSWLAYKKFYYTAPGLAPLAALGGVGLVGWWRTGQGALRQALRRRGRWAPAALALVLLWLPLDQRLIGWRPLAAVPGLGFGTPRAFRPGRMRIEHRLEADLPVLLAVAELRGRVELLWLPTGPKLDHLIRDPDIWSFEHTLDYELARRGVDLVIRRLQARHPVDQVQMVALFGAAGGDLTEQPVEARCLEAAAGGGVRGERIEKSAHDCAVMGSWWAGLRAQVAVLPPQPLSTLDDAERARAFGLVGDGALDPEICGLAVRYAEALGWTDALGSEVRRCAAGADERVRRQVEVRRLRFLEPGTVFPD